MTRGGIYKGFTIIPLAVESPLQTFIKLMLLINNQIRIAAGILLFTTVPTWFTVEAIAPQVVQAYTARADLKIDRLPEENYETLIIRALSAARAAAQRSFDGDILVTDVSVMVSVQNYGAIAPVLELAVTRSQWRTIPDPQRWARYFLSARSLLFFGQTATTNAVPTPTITAPSGATQPSLPNSKPAPSGATQPSLPNFEPPKSPTGNPNAKRQPI
jgi:hypothetical protein